MCYTTGCCGGRYYDPSTNVNACTILVVCLPALIELALFGLALGSVLSCLLALQKNFSIVFWLSTDSYDGLYQIFFNLTTFYATFTAAGSTAPFLPRCLDYSPTVIIKQAVSFCVIGFALQCIVLRVSMEYSKLQTSPATS